jgi:hypothetical protein
VIAEPHAWVPWMLRGACRSPSFSIDLGQKKILRLSVCLQKNLASVTLSEPSKRAKPTGDLNKSQFPVP